MKNSWIGGETASDPYQRPDENLAVAVHGGEPGAFERLIDRFEQPLFNYANGILQNAAGAQRVVQDALMRAHRALTRQFDAARCAALALRPWLFRIVRGLCLKPRRSKRGGLAQPLASFDDGRLGPFVRPETSPPEEAELLQRAMAHLPVDARELIVLRFMEEMSYAEIATTVGSAEGALRGKVFRSLKLLRDALEPKGVAYAM